MVNGFYLKASFEFRRYYTEYWGLSYRNFLLRRRQLQISHLHHESILWSCSCVYILHICSLCFYPLHMASVTDKKQNVHIQTKIAWWNSHITCLLFDREIGKSTAHFPENSCLPLDQNKNSCYISRKQSRHVCKFVTLSILFRLEYFNLVWNVLLLSILYVIFSFVHWRNHIIRTNM